MGIIDDVHELARLRIEGSDLSVTPTADDRLAISHEGDAVALHSRDLDSQNLMAVLCVPDSDVVNGASGENITVVVREHHVVDLVIVTGVPQLRC